MLKQCLESHRPDLLWILSNPKKTCLDEELGNECRVAVLDEFLEKGLNDDDQPNKLGLELETLIDQIGNNFM